MPTVTLNKKDVFKLVDKNISDKELNEKIPLMGLDLEKITKDEITIDISPNRPDILSEEGFSRALASFLGIKQGLKEYTIKKGKYTAKLTPKIKNVRPYAVCAVVKNVKMNNETTKSIMDLQEKLHITHGRNRKKVSIGVYDLDTIEFPITFTTKPLDFKFKPLDTNKEMTLKEILEEHPKGKEYNSLLEGFKEYPIWIDKKEQVLSMPPIINSEETRVLATTKNLFIDITGLNQKAIEQALNIVVCALADRGGEVYSVKVNNTEYPNLESKKIKLNLKYVNQLLGSDFSHNEIKKFLVKMGLDYKEGIVRYPCYRTDILHQMDVVEDIAIGHGYENFITKIPDIATIGEESQEEVVCRKISDLLIGLGFVEVSSYNIMGKEWLEKTNNKVNYIELENSLTKDYNILRPLIYPNLLNIFNKNKHNEFPQKIFEMGYVFNENMKEEQKVGQKLCLSIGVSHPKANFTDTKQIIEYLFSNLDLDYVMSKSKNNSFIDGRIAKATIDKKDLAYFGEIHPQVLENFDIQNPVVVIEVDLNELNNIILKSKTVTVKSYKLGFIKRIFKR